MSTNTQAMNCGAISRRLAFATASVLALCVAEQAVLAQVSPEQVSQTPSGLVVDTDGSDSGAITVTGSRIARDGYTAPTPVSVLGAADIQAQAPPNIADFVNQIPAISGSASPASSTASLSAGNAGISAINLRSIGTGRTLVLIDGQRSVGSNATGQVDVNTIPQALVERVEVVTGGASAAYGSDAVGGVVNFILRKDFTGLELNGDVGETTYGDNFNYNLVATAGVNLLNDRLHIMGNAQYFKSESVPGGTREWAKRGTLLMLNPDYTATNGAPEYLISAGVGPARVTPGGLVLSGPLRGTFFGTVNPATGIASVGQLVFGRQQTTAAQTMLGGDWEYTSQGYAGSSSLEPGQERISAFGRASFDLTPDWNIYASYNYNKQTNDNDYLQPVNGLTGTSTTGGLNNAVRIDNPYLPESVRADMQRLGLTRLEVGTSNAGLPIGGSLNVREVYRIVGGVKGSFDLFSKSWNVDAYYQRGFSRIQERLTNTWLLSRVALASDPVRAPAGNALGVAAGTIVCRSTLTNPTNGCIPMNRIGIGGQSPESYNYILNDGNQPYRFQRLQQDVAALTFSGELFDLPGGPAAIALGGEWRKEQIDGQVDPVFNNGWQYGNYLVNKGSYTVKEAFTELSLPVFTGAELNGAARVTDYSTSGTVATWKVGATWQVIDDLRLRGSYSSDIRAPNLEELFAAGTGRSNSFQLRLPGLPTRTTNFQELRTGNQAVQPEKAKSWTIGAVATPTFAPGLALSVDYYEVKITDAIGVISVEQTAELCYLENVQSFCNNITAELDAQGNPVFFPQIIIFPTNFASQVNKGLDIEASFRTPMDAIIPGAPGNLSLRGLFTHYITNATDDGRTPPRESAGGNLNGPASWNYRLSAFWDADPFTLSLVGRGYSAGVTDPNFFECQTNCPASTVASRTINDNSLPGAFFIDTSIAYKIPVRSSEAQIQLTVTNILNRDPAQAYYGPIGDPAIGQPPASRVMGDRLGRTFRLSLRFKY
ncbi:TonB-dependent receptor plug domain-containing protein [Polymorphobacter sp.]|uniref:TonB-dependent receptor plug domain-containing protein n=1 Tax=Polymorphobacter sp. TaxID=1909290 RepID=UPI003F6F9BA8